VVVAGVARFGAEGYRDAGAPSPRKKRDGRDAPRGGLASKRRREDRGVCCGGRATRRGRIGRPVTTKRGAVATQASRRHQPRDGRDAARGVWRRDAERGARRSLRESPPVATRALALAGATHEGGARRRDVQTGDAARRSLGECDRMTESYIWLSWPCANHCSFCFFASRAEPTCSLIETRFTIELIESKNRFSCPIRVRSQPRRAVPSVRSARRGATVPVALLDVVVKREIESPSTRGGAPSCPPPSSRAPGDRARLRQCTRS
jgi:hypothetical protein